MTEQIPTAETVRAVVEAAIERLVNLGMTREDACALLATQATIRLQHPDNMAAIHDLVADAANEAAEVMH